MVEKNDSELEVVKERLNDIDIRINQSLADLESASTPSDINAQITNIETLIATAKNLNPGKNSSALSRLESKLQEALKKAVERMEVITTRNYSAEGMSVVSEEGEVEAESEEALLKTLIISASNIVTLLGDTIKDLKDLGNLINSGIGFDTLDIKKAKEAHQINKLAIAEINLIDSFSNMPVQKQLGNDQRKELENVRKKMIELIADKSPVSNKFDVMAELEDVSKGVITEDDDGESMTISQKILKNIRTRKPGLSK